MKTFAKIILIQFAALLNVVGEAQVYRAEATMNTPWIKASTPPPNYDASRKIEWREIFWADLGISVALPPDDGGVWRNIPLKDRMYFFTTDSDRYKNRIEDVEPIRPSHVSGITFSLTHDGDLVALAQKLKDLAQDDSRTKGNISDPNKWGLLLSFVSRPIDDDDNKKQNKAEMATPRKPSD